MSESFARETLNQIRKKLGMSEEQQGPEQFAHDTERKLRDRIEELERERKDLGEWRDNLVEDLAKAEAKLAKAVDALRPLIAIADAFDENELDDDARKFWGVNYEHENHKPHDQIELYSGRGGKRLLTLGDAMNARAVLAELEGQ